MSRPLQTSNTYFICNDPPTIDKIFTRLRNYDGTVRAFLPCRPRHSRTTGHARPSKLPQDHRGPDGHKRARPHGRIRQRESADVQAGAAALLWSDGAVQGGVAGGWDEYYAHDAVRTHRRLSYTRADTAARPVRVARSPRSVVLTRNV